MSKSNILAVSLIGVAMLTMLAHASGTWNWVDNSDHTLATLLENPYGIDGTLVISYDKGTNNEFGFFISGGNNSNNVVSVNGLYFFEINSDGSLWASDLNNNWSQIGTMDPLLPSNFASGTWNWVDNSDHTLATLSENPYGIDGTLVISYDKGTNNEFGFFISGGNNSNNVVSVNGLYFFEINSDGSLWASDLNNNWSQIGTMDPLLPPIPRTYVYVPDAIFYQGPPPSPSGNSAALVVSSATPSGPLYINSSITWTVTWPATNETVTYVDLYIPEIGGYFEYKVDSVEDEASQMQQAQSKAFGLLKNLTILPRHRKVHFDMILSDTPTIDTPCRRCTGIPRTGCWCAQEVPTGTTETPDASVNLIGGGGDVGQPLAQLGFILEECGNGICDNGENSSNCPSDCKPACGNGICESGENSSNCPSDCGSTGQCVSGPNDYCAPTRACQYCSFSSCTNTTTIQLYYHSSDGQNFCCNGADCNAAAYNVEKHCGCF